MVAELIAVLSAALHIWESKEKTKYIDKLASLKKDYWNELNKDSANRSDAVLDNILFELHLTCASFCASIGQQKPPNQS